jgi:aryl-alcohol dehydrogenase-like predicted oxidoreductase
VPIEETVGAIADLVKAGYVHHIGLSEVGAAHAPPGAGRRADRRSADRIFADLAWNRGRDFAGVP